MEKGICDGCGEEKYIQNKTKNLCSDCVYKRSHSGKSQIEVQYEKNKQKIYYNGSGSGSRTKFECESSSEERGSRVSDFGIDSRSRDKGNSYNSKNSFRRKSLKPTGERDMFLEIWQERAHYCTNPDCRIFLGNEPKVHFFSHIKPKSVYPELRLQKTNIRLLCFDCHFATDHQGKKIRDEEE